VQLRISFFWDTELGHWVIRSLSFEAALCLQFQEIFRHLEKGALRRIEISASRYTFTQRHIQDGFLFLHRRRVLFGDDGLGSRIWRSLASLHTTVSSLLAKNVINFYSCRPVVANLRSRPKLGARGVWRTVERRFQGELNSYKKCFDIQTELLRFFSCMFCVFDIVPKMLDLTSNVKNVIFY